MADQESRLKYILEFVKKGSGQAVAADINQVGQAQQQAAAKVAQASQQAAAGAQAAGQASQQASRWHRQQAQDAQGLAAALDQVGYAGYHIGMGAMWSGLPGTQWIYQAGNMIQGLQWMIRGFGELAGKIPPAVTAIAAATLAVVGLGMAFTSANEQALDMIERVRTLGEVTTATVSETGRMVNALSGVLGPEGAMASLTGAARVATGTGMMGMFQQMSAAQQAQAQGPGQFYMPVISDQMARWGLSAFQPGSTPQNPMPYQPDEILRRVVEDLASRQGPQRAREMAELAPMFGGQERLGFLTREYERQESAGKHGAEAWAGVTASGAMGWVPSDKDVENSDRFQRAQNEIKLAWTSMQAEVGSALLPVVVSFLEALRDGLGVLKSWIDGLNQVLAPLQQFGIDGRTLGYVVGVLIVAPLVLLAGLLATVVIPTLQFLAVVVNLVLAPFRLLGELVMTIGAALGWVQRPMKQTGDAMGGVTAAWKANDWTGQQHTTKTWADHVSDAFAVVYNAIVGLDTLLNHAPSNFVMNIGVNLQQTGFDLERFMAWLAQAERNLGFTVMLGLQWTGDRLADFFNLLGQTSHEVGVTVRAGFEWVGDRAAEFGAWLGGGLRDFGVTVNVTLQWLGDLAADFTGWLGGGLTEFGRNLNVSLHWAGQLAADFLAWLGLGDTDLPRNVKLAFANAGGAAQDFFNWLGVGTEQLGRDLRLWFYNGGASAQGFFNWLASGAMDLARDVRLWFYLGGGAAQDFFNWLGTATANLGRTLDLGIQFFAGIVIDFAQWLSGNAGPLRRDISVGIQWASDLARQFWDWVTGGGQATSNGTGRGGAAAPAGGYPGGYDPNYHGPGSSMGAAGGSGAIVTRPILSWVGDRGPEAVVPLDTLPGAMPLSALGALGTPRSEGAPVIVYVTVEAMDFSDPLAVERVARAVGDRIGANTRLLLGMGVTA